MNLLTLTLIVTLSAGSEAPPNGSPVEIDYRVGEVTLTVTGRLVPCTQNRRCAQLPNGKRLTGALKDGRFVPEGQR